MIYGKRVTFSAKAITLELEELSSNRILQDDDPSKFIVVSSKDLWFPMPTDEPLKSTSRGQWRLGCT